MKAKSYKTQMYGDGESSGGIVPAKRSNEGLGGLQEIVEGRLPGQGELEPVDTRTGLRAGRVGQPWLGAGAQVGYRSTPLSKVGTVCVRSASTVLCGGCRATGIPTATLASG